MRKTAQLLPPSDAENIYPIDIIILFNMAKRLSKPALCTLILFAMLLPSIPFFGAPCMAEPEGNQSAGSLRVEVAGLLSSQGSVVFALYDSAERYKKHTKAFLSSSLPIIDRTCIWQVDSLPYGEYAVMLYHDENMNGKLDSNLFHVPQEPYGFSNNKRGLLMPASFSDSKFSLQETMKVLVIEVK